MYICLETWLLEDNRRDDQMSNILAVITGFGHIEEEQNNNFDVIFSTKLRQGLINLRSEDT